MDAFHAELLRNLELAKAKRGLRVKQWLVNLRATLFPGMLALMVGKAMADHFYPGKVQTTQWVSLAYGMAILLAPGLYLLINRQHDKSFVKQRLFMRDALQSTLKTHGKDHGSA
jgi:hypothetical protein